MKFHQWHVHEPESWSELINGFVPMDQRYRDAEPWSATLTAQETAAYRLLHSIENGERIAYRTPGLVRRAPCDEHYWILAPCRGAFTLQQGDRVTHIPPGFASLIPVDQSCLVRSSSAEAYSFQMRCSEIDSLVPADAIRRALIDMRTGLGRVTFAMMETAHAERDRLTDREFHAVGDRLSELLSMLILGDLQPQRSHSGDVASLVQRYVRERIGSADVTLAATARALGWSPRRLRSALHEAGTTFRDLRQEEALRAARDTLQDARHQEMAISEVAYRSGFTPAWFSTAFKARYGESPREFRHRRLAGR